MLFGKALFLTSNLDLSHQFLHPQSSVRRQDTWLPPSKYSRLLLSYPLPSSLLFPRINNPNWFNLSVELFREKCSIIILSKKSNNSHNCVFQPTPWPGHFVSQTNAAHVTDTAAAEREAGMEANIPKWWVRADTGGWQSLNWESGGSAENTKCSIVGNEP